MKKSRAQLQNNKEKENIEHDCNVTSSDSSNDKKEIPLSLSDSLSKSSMRADVSFTKPEREKQSFKLGVGHLEALL